MLPETELLHELVHDTTRKSESHELIWVVLWTNSCSISVYPATFNFISNSVVELLHCSYEAAMRDMCVVCVCVKVAGAVMLWCEESLRLFALCLLGSGSLTIAAQVHP